MSNKDGCRTTVTLVLYNDEGKMLLEHRAENRFRYPNVWAMFGGGVDAGETLKQALCREIKEELNYDIKDPAQISVQKLSDGVKYVFVEQYDVRQKLKLDSNESQGYGWFTLEEALKLDTIPDDLKPIHKVHEYVLSRL